jgi:hypothetical protein
MYEEESAGNFVSITHLDDYIISVMVKYKIRNKQRLK